MDFAPSSVLDFKFSTSLDNVPTTLGGTPAVSIYKDNSTTQTTTGVTLSVDFDGITGLHNVRVDTSDSFYASGSSFQGIITTGTVGGNSVVGLVAFEFTLNRAAAYGVVANGAYGNSALKTLIDAIDDLVDTEVAAIKTVVDAVKAKTDNLPSDPADASVVAGLIAAVEAKVDTVDTVVDGIKSTTDKLDDALEDQGGGTYGFTEEALQEAPTGGSAPSAADIRAEMDSNSTKLAAIVADTNELQTDWANGGRLDLILDARASQSSVDDLPTNAELATALGDIPTANENADALLDRADAIETGVTLRGAQRAQLAAALGVATGGDTDEIVFKNPAGNTTRATITTDEDGNRSASVLNV